MPVNNILQLDKTKCCGCRSCQHICPRNCISIKEDYEGFLYPVLKEKLCILCGLCVRHCPVLTDVRKNKNIQKFYAMKLQNAELLYKSTSGGIFSGIAEYILSKEGLVFGCVFDAHLQVKHIYIDKNQDLYQLQGSKYIASDTRDTFKEVRKLLREKKTVLYSGTPCQITGLRAFLGMDYDNLFTIDLVCHGVPSQKLFNKYLEWLGSKNKGKILYYSFRDKDASGWRCGGKLKTKTKTKTKTIEAVCDPYYASFLRGETYRESCYSCLFANMNRVGDLTIGDFWGIEEFYPDFYSKDGVSLCIVNTKKGNELLLKLQNKFIIFETTEMQIVKHNSNLQRPTTRPKIRDNIYNKIETSAFIVDLHKYLKYKNRVIFYLQAKIMKILSKCIPQKIKSLIKSVFFKKNKHSSEGIK